ncbi:PatB family C-S lyase [Pullulanibacillus sp. KACC 23026]|uniref:MalY/PatB family protein n=1 Tax=Pullulanibacillus sp. KACC 23026 TaxID=3028315 RepID=UPI0023B1651F|nr:PatB family C-S lyase [Pullulanibacillus sp. KACC 23026]WEG12554.1 PatB family C-S lyase [Pullulanibacillus sp. KACC 23026]
MSEVNLDEWIDRRGTNSVKWEHTKQVFGHDDLLPLWVADMDFQTPAEVTESILKRAKHPIYGYPGTPESLKTAIKEWIGRRLHTSIDTSHLVFLPGVVYGLHLAAMTLTSPGDKIIVQSPVYPPFFSSVEKTGRHVVENPLIDNNGRYEMDFDQLESIIDRHTKAIFLCSPHNPVGRVWIREELTKLGEIAVKHGLIVVSDEIHGDLVLGEHVQTPFYSLPDQLSEQSICFMAPSKTFNLAGLFASYALIKNKKLRLEFENALARTGAGRLNLFGIEAMEAAYTFGDEWLEEVRRYLDGNADYLVKSFQERIPQIKMTKPEGTYLAWLDCRELKMDDEALKQWMIHEARLGLNAGITFGKQGSGYMRLNFACPRSLLEEAISRLEAALKKL